MFVFACLLLIYVFIVMLMFILFFVLCLYVHLFYRRSLGVTEGSPRGHRTCHGPNPKSTTVKPDPCLCPKSTHSQSYLGINKKTFKKQKTQKAQNIHTKLNTTTHKDIFEKAHKQHKKQRTHKKQKTKIHESNKQSPSMLKYNKNTKRIKTLKNTKINITIKP